MEQTNSSFVCHTEASSTGEGGQSLQANRLYRRGSLVVDAEWLHFVIRARPVTYDREILKRRPENRDAFSHEVWDPDDDGDGIKRMRRTGDSYKNVFVMPRDAITRLVLPSTLSFKLQPLQNTTEFALCSLSSVTNGILPLITVTSTSTQQPILTPIFNQRPQLFPHDVPLVRSPIHL